MSQDGDESYSSGFLAFWDHWPWKRNKRDAYRAYLKLGPDEDLQRVILTAADRLAVEWSNGRREDFPLPAHWLHYRLWEWTRADVRERER